MGLTIHYNLQSDVKTISEARKQVNLLHEKMSNLPFQEVLEIQEFKGDACNFNKNEDEDNRGLLIQAGEYVDIMDYGHKFSCPVAPMRIIAFTGIVGDGCEPMNIGLVRYPKTIIVDGRRHRTNLPGWRWYSFCKTQYASNPDCGGVKNFLRCHMSVLALLEYAKQIGLTVDVSDEGGFWEKRDIKALVEEIGEWNSMLAAFAGTLKDQMSNDLDIQSAIAEFPNFEHLEADGQKNIPENGLQI